MITNGNILPPDTGVVDYLHAGLPVPEPPAWSPLSLDSIFASYTPQVPPVHESMFIGHELSRVHSEGLLHTSMDTPLWMFVSFVAVAALFSIFINAHRISLRNIVPAAFSIRELDRFYRENNFKRGLSAMPMLLIYAAALSLMVFFLFPDRIHWPAGRLCVWAGSLLVGISVFLMVKNALIQFLGNVFGNSVASQLYTASNYVYQCIAGVLLFPVLLFAAYGGGYGNVPVWVPVGIVGIVFALRVLRGLILILSNATSSKFYLFYYLCILEIVPLLLLWKSTISV